MTKHSNERLRYGLGLVALAVLVPSVAQAYVGPGLGLGAIASVFAFLGAVVLGVVGFVWYPIKRLLRAFRRPAATDE
jgi:hypothetical protein